MRLIYPILTHFGRWRGDPLLCIDISCMRGQSGEYQTCTCSVAIGRAWGSTLSPLDPVRTWQKGNRPLLCYLFSAPLCTMLPSFLWVLKAARSARLPQSYTTKGQKTATRNLGASTKAQGISLDGPSFAVSRNMHEVWGPESLFLTWEEEWVRPSTFAGNSRRFPYLLQNFPPSTSFTTFFP